MTDLVNPYDMPAVAFEDGIKQLLESPTWPIVVDFGFVMEHKLAANRHKGDREGWLRDSPLALISRAFGELRELYNAVFDNEEPDAVWFEAADVANMVVMVADSYARRAKERSP